MIMNFFIPLMAIVGSYSSYGKDRISGVLESVLSRPVSRRGLGISRYLSTFLALGVAIAISISVVDVILKIYTGSFLDASLALGAAGAFLVEVAAFVGLMFLFSHLFKSTGLLIGIGIGLFVVLDLFWQLIIFLLTSAVGATFGSAVFLQVSVLADFFNPTQFISLVYTYITNQFQFFGFIQPSLYGITIPSLVLTAILWIALPFSLFLYRAIKKD
jgi:ABC-2 type transport system permease protein